MYKIPEIICILLPIAFCSVVVYNYIARLRKEKQLACENNFKNIQKSVDKFKWVCYNKCIKKKKER